MKDLKFIYALTVLIVLGAIISSCAPVVGVKMLKPAEIDLSSYKNITVMEFSGEGGNKVARWTESDLLKVKIDGEPYFKIVARDQLSRVMEEQRLSKSGAINQKSATKMRQLLGVQAIVSGNVDALEIGKNWKTYSFQDLKGNVSYVDCLDIVTRAAFTINFISTETGSIEFSETLEGYTNGQKCNNGQNKGDLGSDDQLQSLATRRAIEKFITKITPHYVTVNVTFKNSADDSLLPKDKAAKEKIESFFKTGLDYVRANQWDMAIKSFENVLVNLPNEPYSLYNIGLSYEIKGQLEKARSYYQKAVNIKPTDTTLGNALSQVEQRIQEQEQVKKQLRKSNKKTQYLYFINT